MNNQINDIYNQLRVKSLALIAGEVALITFIFTGWDFLSTLVVADRAILLGIGVACLILAFALLLWIVSTSQWQIAHDNRSSSSLESDKNLETEEDFIRYLHDDYCSVNQTNMKLVTSKSTKFNWCIYSLAAGAIIVMVIRFGGPQ